MQAHWCPGFRFNISTVSLDVGIPITKQDDRDNENSCTGKTLFFIETAVDAFVRYESHLGERLGTEQCIFLTPIYIPD